MKKFFIGSVIAVLFLAGCSDASIASHDLSKAADQFEIDRRIVFYDGINAEYMLTVEGRCSIKEERNERKNQLSVTCKTGEDQYKKHFLGLSDNVSYFAEQIESAPVDVYHYRVIFKPEAILPDIDLVTSD